VQRGRSRSPSKAASGGPSRPARPADSGALTASLLLGAVVVIGAAADRLVPHTEEPSATHEVAEPEPKPPVQNEPTQHGPVFKGTEPSREIAGAAHILLAYKGALGASPSVQRSKEEARRQAEEIRRKLVADESKFAALANEHSDDLGSRPMGGALGNFERYAMPKAFADATFALKVGEISEVVETPRGFHIIRRTR